MASLILKSYNLLYNMYQYRLKYAIGIITHSISHTMMQNHDLMLDILATDILLNTDTTTLTSSQIPP